jgi:neutral ceramidase
MIYRIGVGKSDITGPCAQIGFMGMSNENQTGKGIQSRLFARAFVIDDGNSGRVAIVIADLAICSLAVKAAVVKRLSLDTGLSLSRKPLYTDENVLVAATHTHSGPGGYSHFLAYNASIMGFNDQNFDTIVDGIHRSIRRAHDSLQPGRILVSRGQVAEVGDNRSLPAYNQNPADERQLYPLPVDREMTLLQFLDSSEKIIGTLNWCAVHPTNMGELNQLISGDSKGYAEELMEKHVAGLLKIQDWQNLSISAFANSCCGDSSPNVKTGRPNGKDDLARALSFGKHQFDAAKDLLEDKGEELSGPVRVAHRYVDFGNVTIEGTKNRTWPPAMGYGMINGSSEDSTGMGCDQWGEGTTRANFEPAFCLKLEAVKALSAAAGVKWPTSSQIPGGYVDGHGEKAIVFPLGLATYKGVPLAPSILPLQIIKVGSLAILAHPGEMTAMAGRRVRKAIAAELECDTKDVVIATYANAYSSYTATREEYALQHYEGASTLFGPWTLSAYLQENVRLARFLKTGVPVGLGAVPVAVPEKGLLRTMAYSWPDKAFGGLRPGDVASNVRPAYKRGEIIKVVFLGGYPNYDMRSGSTFLAIERKEGGAWPANPRPVYSDHDSCTSLRCDLASGSSFLTIEWTVPDEETLGTYRIRYFGSFKSGVGRKPRPLIGTSPEFKII